MVGIKERNRAVLSHWYSVIDGVQFSTDEFYRSVEEEVAARMLPGLVSSRVAYFQAGLLSDKRVYLRLARGRYAFDICAAPFGRAYFFSLRLVELAKWSLLKIVVGIGVLSGISAILWPSKPMYGYQPNGNSHVLLWLLVFVAAMIGIVVFASERSLSRKGGSGVKVSGFDPADFSWGDVIERLPIIGDWYEVRRKDTYYRHDTRLLYYQLVSEIVKKKVEEVTAEKGVKLIREFSYSPFFDDLYTVKQTARDDAAPK